MSARAVKFWENLMADVKERSLVRRPPVFIISVEDYRRYLAGNDEHKRAGCDGGR